MGLITKGYEKWGVLKLITEYGYYESETEHSLKFVFEKEKCIDDLIMGLLERKGSITKEEYVKIKSDAREVKLISYDRGYWDWWA
jgi:hypothetical protein